MYLIYCFIVKLNCGLINKENKLKFIRMSHSLKNLNLLNYMDYIDIILVKILNINIYITQLKMLLITYLILLINKMLKNKKLRMLRFHLILNVINN